MTLAEPAPGLASYAPSAPDLALTGDGALRPPYAPWFERLGPASSAEIAVRSRLAWMQVAASPLGFGTAEESEAGGLDLFPVVIPAEEWTPLAQRLAQTARALCALLQDAYGPQRMIREGWVPADVVLNSPGFAADWAGHPAASYRPLRSLTFRLLPQPDGTWTEMGVRAGVIPPLGAALRNRALARAAFPAAPVAHEPGGALREWLRVLRLERGVVLGSGLVDRRWSELAWLAREADVPLAERRDLLLRDEQLFLRMVEGLRPVGAVLVQGDAASLDPERDPAARHGVPGLHGALLAGSVATWNAPGSLLAQDPALGPFLGNLSRALLGQDLAVQASSPCTDPDWRSRLATSWVADSEGRKVNATSLDEETLAALEEDIAARPARFALRPAFEPPTLPALVEGKWVPSRVELEVSALWVGSTVEVPPVGLVTWRAGAGRNARGHKDFRVEGPC